MQQRLFMKTQEQADRIASKRLEKKFGRDLTWYDEQLKLQGGTCALCPSTEKTRRLHVDHDHKVSKVKVHTEKTPTGLWKAWAIYRGVTYLCGNKKRNEAIKEVKGYLKRSSIRGLLCFRCNKFLVGNSDPNKLRKAADYLEEHQGVKDGQS
jgi:hypothetical protein